MTDRPKTSEARWQIDATRLAIHLTDGKVGRAHSLAVILDPDTGRIRATALTSDFARLFFMTCKESAL